LAFLGSIPSRPSTDQDEISARLGRLGGGAIVDAARAAAWGQQAGLQWFADPP